MTRQDTTHTMGTKSNNIVNTQTPVSIVSMGVMKWS